MLWTAARLRALLATHHAGESIVVLANREPYRHDAADGDAIAVTRCGGGLVTALEPVVRACSGVWVAHGSGTADWRVVDASGCVDVPPDDPAYRLRRVRLDPADTRGYYYGFANEGLWPLCHRAGVRPVFRVGDFERYRSVNARFAAAVCAEAISGSPVVLVQDYHFALAPLMIRERLRRGTIVSFWHIPWPRTADYVRCPWAATLIEGLLGSDIVGFQTEDDCRHFMDAARALLGAELDPALGTITHEGVRTAVRAYPVSVEYPNQWAKQSPSIARCRADVRRRLGLNDDALLGVGVDRLDYTKGLEEKFLTVERMLDDRPELRGRFVFVQIAEPSRECLPAYRDLRERLWRSMERINRRFAGGGYRPIVLCEARHEPPDVYRYLRAADVCYVGSLQDGMNLVAKEFITARDDERGVLVLSRYAGAARQLKRALVVNPRNLAGTAQALARALTMSVEEQSARMRDLRAIVADYNAYRWAGDMLVDAARMRDGSASVLALDALEATA